MTRLAVWWTLLPTAVPAPPPGGAPGSERGEEFGKTSPIALVVILLLGVATALLIRSMTKHLRKVPASFDAAEEDGSGRPDAEAAPDDEDRSAPAHNGTDRTDRPPGAGSP
ncbi:hypothetical protein EV188_104130 [Actinomycetospora succinea]|uniref:Uncharacterized protein n=1 Tax=Actinomycetospora succinea TaxID=663603 RepID=A0A4R6VDE4_9PSEU|nr:hypothetical protein [Actinomycetospora succinea]TDQ58390.1 hypothetical protein EV188_104130 [Actinomycetospora succinea]